MPSLLLVLVIFDVLAFNVVNCESLSKAEILEFLGGLEDSDPNQGNIFDDSKIAKGLKENDINQDNQIDESEFNSYLKSINIDSTFFRDVIFNEVDTDGNGLIDEENAKRLFKFIDVDDNDVVSREEYEDILEAIV